MSKKFIITIVTLLVIATAAGFAIFLAKGYTFSTKEKRIVGTGIITVSSEPDSASVFVDGHLTTATNATISSLPTKSYNIKITKEGFIPWERSVEVKEGLVSELKVTLFPAIPTIYPLTFNGVSSPVLSPDASKLVYVAKAGKKPGIWVWTMAKNQPIAFTRSSEPHQIANSSLADLSKVSFKWSPDSKQVLATVGNQNFLLNADSLNTEPRDITAILQATLKGWEDDTKAKEVARIETIKDSRLKQIASDSARPLTPEPARQSPEGSSRMADGRSDGERAKLNWSPDETKFMTENRVYDLVDVKDFPLPSARTHIWLPDSRHIVMVEDGTISIIDFDGTNKAIIYAGKFDDSLVFPWPDSSRLVIISSFPTPTASEPNFYGINLK